MIGKHILSAYAEDHGLGPWGSMEPVVPSGLPAQSVAQAGVVATQAQM